MKKLRYGIVGFSCAGKTHARVLDEKLKDCVNLSAICDINEENLSRAKELYDVSVMKDYEEFLSMDLDAISICTPHYLHFPMIKEALCTQIPFLVEKPVVISSQEGAELSELVKEKSNISGTVLQHRFEYANKLVKKAIDKGELGKLYSTSVNVKWKKTDEYFLDWHGSKELSGGGVLMTQAIHMIDLACWFNGGVKTVYGELRFDKGLPVEDSAFGILKYNSGAGGVIDCSTSTNPGFGSTIEIIGKKSAVKLYDGRILKWGGKSEDEISKINQETDLIASQTLGKKYYGYGHIFQIQDFVSAVSENRSPLVSIEEGLKTLEVILSLEKSWREKKEVVLE